MNSSSEALIKLALKGQRAEKREKAIDGCLISILTVVVLTAIQTQGILLGVGALHDWIRAVPTIGWQDALGLVVLLRACGAAWGIFASSS